MKLFHQKHPVKTVKSIAVKTFFSLKFSTAHFVILVAIEDLTPRVAGLAFSTPLTCVSNSTTDVSIHTLVPKIFFSAMGQGASWGKVQQDTSSTAICTANMCLAIS